MPNKWLNQKNIEIKKKKYKVSNWSDYNNSLKNRGNIEVWLSKYLINHWAYHERIYDGTGSSANGMRNRNILEISENGRMNWQKERSYGQRNYSELGVQRYKRILGRAMHARKMPRQKQEFMIGCGILNKITSLGMPESYRVA